MSDAGDRRERDDDGPEPTDIRHEPAENRHETPPPGDAGQGGATPEHGGANPEPGQSPPGPGGGLFGLGRSVDVGGGERRPVASLLRRGTALAVDIFFGLLVVAIAIDALSYFVPLDTDQAVGPMVAPFGLLAAYILWFRDRGATRPGGGLRTGLSPGRWLLGLRLVPVAGPRRLTRPVTVADGVGAEGETMRIVRAVLLGIAASLVSLMLLGHALSRTVVFRTVVDHAARNAPFAAERGGAPELAGIPSALLIGLSQTRAYVRVDATWGERGDPLEFFLERADDEWRVTVVRIGGPGWRLPDYALSAPDADVPTP